MFLKICDSEIHGHSCKDLIDPCPFHKNLHKKRKGERGREERETDRQTDEQGFPDLPTSMSCLYHHQDRC